jgi:acyl-coenzyme A synthetase/AMP-(fatty) acid ligase/acyl carrier protein
MSLLQGLGPSVLLTQQSLIYEEPEVMSEIIRLDSDWELISQESGTNPDSRVRDENLAFITSTSGSTGEPKRVMITHCGLRNQLRGMQEAVGLTEADRVLQQCRLSIGASKWETLWPLLAGVQLIMAGPKTYRNHDSLPALIAERHITTVSFTPSIFSLLMREDRLGDCRSLRRIILSGETLNRPVQERCYERLNVDLYDLYCVSEATGAVTGQVYRPRLIGEISASSRPLIYSHIYILDPYLQPAPGGVAGEVWVSGKGLARGYAGRPDSTAERFIPNPFSADPGGRMMRTGDMAQGKPDGKIDVLGLRKNQITMKFGRIAPSQVESVLVEYPGIDQAALLIMDDAFGGARLAAYLGCSNDGAPSADELRRRLRGRFPAQLTPSAFVMMKTLPLTLNDRIDRKALTAMRSCVTDSEMGSAAIITPHEEMLRVIWSELFGVDEVSSEDNFFDMGGHSLLATQVVSRVRDVFKVEIPLRSIFEEPTISGFARRIEEVMKAGGAENAPPLVRVSREGALPLSFAQQRLWFLDQLVPNSPLYNNPGAVRS